MSDLSEVTALWVNVKEWNHDKNSHLHIVLTALFSLVKDKVLHCANNEHLRDYHMACWELEFQAVAQKLIRALESKEQTD